MPLSTKADFVDHLLVFPEGHIILCNMLDGLDEGLFTRPFVQELIDWWQGLFLWQVSRNYAKGMTKSEEIRILMSSLEDVLFHKQPDGFRPGRVQPTFLLVCTLKPRKTGLNSELINVISSAFFINELLHKDDLRTLAMESFRYYRRPGAREVAGIFVPPRKQEIRLQPGRVLGRRGRVLWLTPAKPIETSLADARAADRVRDRLGLIHHKLAASLVALYLPGKAIESLPNGRPTFADGGAHGRFKSRADTAANRKRCRWGHTADLHKFGRGARYIDGQPERVSNPILGAKLGRIAFIPLGNVRTARGANASDDDVAFANRLHLRHGGMAGIRQRVLNIL